MSPLEWLSDDWLSGVAGVDQSDGGLLLVDLLCARSSFPLLKACQLAVLRGGAPEPAWARTFGVLHTLEVGTRFGPWAVSVRTCAGGRPGRFVSLDLSDHWSPDVLELVTVLVQDGMLPRKAFEAAGLLAAA